MYPGETDEFNKQFEVWKKTRPPLDRNGLEERLRRAAKKMNIPDIEFQEYLDQKEKELERYQNEFEEEIRAQQPTGE
jgi:hypothetical protein